MLGAAQARAGASHFQPSQPLPAKPWQIIREIEELGRSSPPFVEVSVRTCWRTVPVLEYRKTSPQLHRLAEISNTGKAPTWRLASLREERDQAPEPKWPDPAEVKPSFLDLRPFPLLEGLEGEGFAIDIFR